MIKYKISLIAGLILVIYATIGGLSLPLSPNIEKVQYISPISDSTITLGVWAPKASKSSNQFFLVHNTFDSSKKWILASKNITASDSQFTVSFIDPSTLAVSQKGDNYDLWMQNPKDGSMVYFQAFTIDSIKGSRTTEMTPKSALLTQKEFKWAFPNRPILRESIRNLFLHVPMWFGMMAMLIASLVYSIRFLSSGNLIMDKKAKLTAEVGLLFGTLGILTGMVWAKYTWGAFWTDDPKLNGAAIGMLIYLAYMVLRSSLNEPVQRGKLSAVYNIFGFSLYFVFIYILPRLKSSLHPGNGGNPGFNIYEQDNTMRMFFYPAVIGWILIGWYLKSWRFNQAKN